MPVRARILILSIIVCVAAILGDGYASDVAAKRGKIVGGLSHEIPRLVQG